jgi:hypothetical protein
LTPLAARSFAMQSILCCQQFDAAITKEFGSSLKKYFALGYGSVWIVGYIAALLLVIWLCDVLPIVGYPLALIFLIWVFKSKGGSGGEVLDTESPPDDFRHRH